MTLVVVSHVLHHVVRGAHFAYGPYVREIDEWSRLFDRVVIAAPITGDTAPRESLSYQSGAVTVCAVPRLGGPGLWNQLGLLLGLPRLAWTLWAAMSQADVVHVRCPGNVGLMGTLLAPLTGKRRIAKYAGLWGERAGEAISYRLQKAVLRSGWWRGPVLVYGQWTNQPSHLVPFFNSSLTEAHMTRAAGAARRIPPPDRNRILFVGRLSRAKRADTALRACAKLVGAGIAVTCRIIGDGPERERLESLVRDLDLTAAVEFQGSLDFESVLAAYEEADALVLPSETEGWPKVLAEAMAFGVPCIATDQGLNPWMLGEGRGFTAPFDDVDSFATAIGTVLAEDPEARARRRQACARFGQQYTIEGVREGLKDILDGLLRQPAGGARA